MREVALSFLSRIKKRENEEFREKRIAGRLMIIGTNFIAGVVVLGYLGHLLDQRLGYEYRYTATGALLGIVWALYEAIKQALLLSREEKGGEKKDNQAKDDE
jgi:F0F1-type ATP synthase assembly protein I